MLLYVIEYSFVSCMFFFKKKRDVQKDINNLLTYFWVLIKKYIFLGGGWGAINGQIGRNGQIGQSDRIDRIECLHFTLDK